MQRITISIDDGLAETFDRTLKARAYESRSEALRDIVRKAVERWRMADSRAEFCVANLSYVYDRNIRSLAERLSGLEHENHDLVACSNTLRLDHSHSLVSVMFKGRTAAVRALVDKIAAQRGVRFAEMNIVAVDPDDEHKHAGSHEHHGHDHLTPATN